MFYIVVLTVIYQLHNSINFCSTNIYTKMTAAYILDVSHTLNPSGGKMVKVAIEVTDKCQVVVMLNKTGGRVLTMSVEEFQLLVNHQSLITNYFESGDALTPGSLLILNKSLRVRFDNTFKDKTMILERFPDMQVPRNPLVCPFLFSVFMMAKTWQGLVDAMPMLNYVIESRQRWCRDVEVLLKKTVQVLQESHAQELERVMNLKDFTTLLQSIDTTGFTLNVDTDIDVKLCMFQLLLLCSPNFHVLALTNK
jgi:hypothetical protein